MMMNLTNKIGMLLAITVLSISCEGENFNNRSSLTNAPEYKVQEMCIEIDRGDQTCILSEKTGDSETISIPKSKAEDGLFMQNITPVLQEQGIDESSITFVSDSEYNRLSYLAENRTSILLGRENVLVFNINKLTGESILLMTLPTSDFLGEQGIMFDFNGLQCSTAIGGGVITGALGGAAVGSAVPGLGTAAGAILGGLGGFLTAFSAGCSDII